MYNHYNPHLREYAHELRNQSVSKAEKYLWKAGLRRKQLGVKFKRQRPIDRFIVDFFCAELKLIIEIDGSSHFPNRSISIDKRCPICRASEVPPTRLKSLKAGSDIKAFRSSRSLGSTDFVCNI